MKNYSYAYGMENYIPANNLSKGFHGILFEYLKEWTDPQDNILLIGENEDVIPVFKERLKYGKIDTMGYNGEKGETYNIDLNILQEFKEGYHIIFSQALLEHLCRPSVAIENMVNLCYYGGCIILHTHSPLFPYHAYPVDCCRFHKDYFKEMEKYLPVIIRAYDEWDNHIFVCYQKRRRG